MFSTLYCSLVSNSSLAYQTGPTVYCSRTVFEDATPELVRDFFWDDEFRPKWDPMLAYCKILEECRDTGTMIVHWIKKVCGTWECMHSVFLFDRFLVETCIWFLTLLRYAVPFLLQWSRIYNWSKNMGGWKNLLLCDKGTFLKHLSIHSLFPQLIIIPVWKSRLCHSVMIGKEVLVSGRSIIVCSGIYFTSEERIYNWIVRSWIKSNWLWQELNRVK